ncbi:MAG: exodeoxyribonuclease VII large subunit [Sarcina sp.]
MKLKTLTVTAVNDYVKRIIDNDFILNNLSVKGEISNLKIHSSGHIYFSLKDENSKINCVMFKSDAVNLNFDIANGIEVILKARLSLYSKDGVYQLYCKEISKLGIGELFEKFELLKKQLKNEGLFETGYKRKINIYPNRIGVITSATGAAVRDIINVIKRRNKIVDIVIYPANVQGVFASETIINGIRYFNNKKSVDTIIVGRGGGSIEELWPFNDVELAYEIFNSKIPIISAVGHETDFTICDFVADLRAATPSVAAEVCVCEIEKEKNNMKVLENILNNKILKLIQLENINLNYMNKILEENHPIKIIENKKNKLNDIKFLMDKNIKIKIKNEKQAIISLNKLLQSMNPLNILDKGFSVISTDNGTIIKSISELAKFEKIKIKMKDGEAKGSFEILE